MISYAVIMAGGSGKRLWPLSRKKSPKQFLDIFGDGSFLESTIDRLTGVIPGNRVIIAGSEEQKEQLCLCVGERILKENILLEPAERNTAPCIALAAQHIAAQAGEDVVMCVLPSDHFIENVPEFQATLRHAIDIAKSHESIITIGITPTYPATGFGYIQSSKPLSGEKNAFHVERFVEKPDIQRAKEYVSAGHYYWNGGMFITRVKVMLDHIRRFMPDLYSAIGKIHEDMMNGREESAAEGYRALKNISIDYGVMEKSQQILTVPSDFGWNDMGSFEAISQIAGKDESGNAVLKGQHFAINAHGNMISAEKKLIALMDVDELVVIDTGDILYIGKKDTDVRQVTEKLDRMGLEDCK